MLLVLEGYDELPASLRDEASLVRQVVNGDQFDAGTVLVTSRHWASEPFLLPSNTSRPVSQHIEILGFTRENIKDYVSSMLEKEPSLLKDFQQYLEICPHIRSMMYIPLNCAIVVDVYRHSKKENMIIPKTTTELYLSLTQSLLLRHIYPEYKNITLNNLPLNLRSHFDNLAGLAYKGICLNQQQVIFTEEELCGLDTLGFMQSSMELHVDEGAKKSFNFLHLTIQEFLAAYHIFSHHSSDSQVEAFNNNDKGMVPTFLAGLSPSSLLKSLPKGEWFRENNIHRLFEARGRVKLPYKVCTGFVKNPFYSYMLGHLIANSSCPWRAGIEGTKEAINLFVIGLSACGDRQCRAEVVTVSEASNIAELSKAKLALEQLHFLHRDASLPEQNHADICLFFDNLSSGSPLSFKHFMLRCFHLNNEETKKFKSYLMMCSIIKSLALSHCKFESNAAAILMDGVKACSSLEKLTIELSDNWCDAVCEMLIGNKTLKKLKVESSDHHSVCALIHALHMNHTLEKLTIKRNKWALWTNIDKFVRMERLPFLPSIFQKQSRVSSELAKMLIQNKSLKKLDVCNCELDLQGDIRTALCENCTLSRLSISVERGPELEAISELLKRNKTLKVLQLVLDVEGASTIAEVMCENNTLEELHIVGKIGAHEAFATMLKRNTSLRKLSMAWYDQGHYRDEEFAILSNALSQNKSLQQLKVYDPGLSELQLETQRKCEDARMQCTHTVRDIIKIMTGKN